jgi:hypothetical protein
MKTAPEVGQDEGLHDLREQHHGGPEARAHGLEQEGVAIQDLQDPVRAADEAGQAQCENVVRCELLDHLRTLQQPTRRQQETTTAQEVEVLQWVMMGRTASTEGSSWQQHA